MHRALPLRSLDAMRKPDANCQSRAQKPRGEGESEGGKGRSAPTSARIGVAAHVAHVPLRHGTERAAADMATCSRLQEINWQVPLNGSWDIREALRRTCRRPRRQRPRRCRRCCRWHQAEISGVPGVLMCVWQTLRPHLQLSILRSSSSVVYDVLPVASHGITPCMENSRASGRISVSPWSSQPKHRLVLSQLTVDLRQVLKCLSFWFGLCQPAVEQVNFFYRFRV